MVKQFRKKPVVIRAVQWNGAVSMNDIDDLAYHYAKDPRSIVPAPLGTRILTIRTLEGNMTAYPGDWIICGVKGELYPCKPDIFEATYEEVAAPPSGSCHVGLPNE